MKVPGVTFPRPRLERTLVRSAQFLLEKVGAGELYVKALSPDGAIVLMYHGLVRPSDEGQVDPRGSVTERAFERQMRFLSEHRQVIAMSDLVDRMQRGARIAPGTVVITFDDGYKSTLDVAAPILHRYDLPAIVYLLTGYVSRAESQFVDVLYSAFKLRSRHHLSLPREGIDVPNLHAPGVAARVFGEIEQRLLSSDLTERELLLSEVLAQLRPRKGMPRLTLNWQEVDRLRRQYPRFELGVHTRNHIDLTRCGVDVAEREVAGSIEDLSREAGLTPLHFSFPFGRSNADARAVVTRTELRSAAVTDPTALVRTGTDFFAIPRLEAPSDMRLFRLYTSGAYPGLSLMLLGRTCEY